MSLISIEKRPSPITTDLPSPSESDGQHSEKGFTLPEVTQGRIERLKSAVQNGRKPYRILDISTYSPDPTGIKSFDQIVLRGEAAKISVNRSTDLDTVDYSCASTPERIVRVQANVEGAPVRGSSAHGVLFLRLGTQKGELLDVAIKAFEKPSKAFTEYVNTQVILERGINTLQPIAVILENSDHSNTNGSSNGNGKKSSAGKKEPIGFYISGMESIRSLDRLRVIRNGYMRIVNGGEKEKKYLEYLSMAGKLLAEMHLKGVFPKDSQIKNFAIRGNGSVIPIDFENTSIFNQDFFATCPEKFITYSQKGLSVLFGSLNKETDPPIDFFAGFTGESLWDAFNTTVFSSYRQTYEEIILSTDQLNLLNIDQFSQALENLELIQQGIKERILNPVAVAH